MVSNMMTPLPTSCIRSLSEETMVRRRRPRRQPRIGGDEVVGLAALLLEAGESKACIASRISGNCGTQVLRRLRPVRLVVGIDIVAEGLLRLVEDHRDMRRLVLRLHLGQQLPQHVAEAEHGADRQAVGLARERRQRVIGAENVAGAVDQEEVVALLQRARRRGGGLGAGGGFGFGWRLWFWRWLAWPECGPGRRDYQSLTSSGHRNRGAVSSLRDCVCYASASAQAGPAGPFAMDETCALP